MSGDEKDLASRLLDDAGVEHLLRELTGDRFAEVVARDVDEFFAIADRLTLGELFDRELLRDQAQFAIEQLANTPNIRDVFGDLAQAIYDLSANEEFRLGDIIDRNRIQLLIRQVLSMDTMTDRALERLTESSIAATVASEFVNKIPGLGNLTGAWVLTEIGDDRTHFADARGLEAFAGSAPITRASGKKTIVLHRHIKNRRFAAVGSIWALASLRSSPGARCHFDARPAAGDWNRQAQRHLFNKFLGQLHHCLQTGLLYDENRAFPPPLPRTA